MELKQAGTIREYVETFTSLMPGINDMTTADRLFHSIAGLEPWAQAELRRQGAVDLPTAIIQVEALMDDWVTHRSSSGMGTTRFMQWRPDRGKMFSCEPRGGRAHDTPKTIEACVGPKSVCPTR